MLQFYIFEFLKKLDVLWIAARISGLDDIDPCSVKSLKDLKFIFDGKRDSFGLRTVS